MYIVIRPYVNNAGTDMNGHYLYDDEGVKTHRVDTW